MLGRGYYVRRGVVKEARSKRVRDVLQEIIELDYSKKKKPRRKRDRSKRRINRVLKRTKPRKPKAKPKEIIITLPEPTVLAAEDIGKKIEDVTKERDKAWDDMMRVTPRKIYHIKKQYEETGKIPELRQPGRKPKQIDRKTEQIILQAYSKYKLSPVPLEKLIERDYGIHVPHNTIYKVLLKNNLWRRT